MTQAQQSKLTIVAALQSLLPTVEPLAIIPLAQCRDFENTSHGRRNKKINLTKPEGKNRAQEQELSSERWFGFRIR